MHLKILICRKINIFFMRYINHLPFEMAARSVDIVSKMTCIKLIKFQFFNEIE